MSTRYTLGRDVGPEEEVHDSYGNRVDEDYVEQAVSDVHHALGRLPAEEREQDQRLAEEQGS